jgi:glycosyltransferase involved in cell wall biosynthesis
VTAALRFTVLIDTYNHERFIAKAIESALAQDLPAREFEILVVDDGSTDATRGVVRSFGGRVRLIAKPNGGQASAFNVGLREARAEWVALLDGDDWWAPAKLSRLAEFVDSHPDVGVIGHGIEQVQDATGESVRTVPASEREFNFASVADTAAFRRMLCFFGTSRLAVRRDVALKALPIPEAITIQADEFLATVSVAYSRAAVLSDPLTFYRLHADNLFQMPTADDRKLRRMQRALGALAAALPTRLEAAGVGAEAIRALLDPLLNNVKRLQLRLDGGMPWETFRVEMAERRFCYADAPLGYRIYAAAATAAALVIPPRLYYRLREWYSASAVRRMRGILGEPVRVSGVESVPSPSTLAKASH